MVIASARYSASADERETVDCHLDFHEIDEAFKKIQNHVVDFHVSRHEPQSASENTCNLIGEVEDAEKN